MAAEFSPDAKYIATVSMDNSAIIWCRNTGKIVHKLEEHEDLVSKVVFSKDSKLLITTSDDDNAIVWDVESGTAQHTLAIPKTSIWMSQISYDSS